MYLFNTTYIQQFVYNKEIMILQESDESVEVLNKTLEKLSTPTKERNKTESSELTSER